MRSIPVAIVWELFSRGRWNLIVGFVSANAIPWILFLTLQHLGVFDLEGEARRIIHNDLVLFNEVIFAFTVLASIGSPSRLYAYPIRTSSLVSLQMFPAMLLVGIEMVISTLMLNRMFQLDWPIWGPALFSIATWAVCQTAFWYTEKSGLFAFAIAIAAGAMGFWYMERFSPLRNHAVPEGLPDVNAVEVLMLGLILAVSYYFGIDAVARNRCGESLKPLGIVAWICRLLDLESSDSKPFGSADEAQYWFEWQVKGWAMPGIVAFGSFVMLTVWLLNSRNPRELVDSFIAGGALLSVAGMIFGMVMGNQGPSDGHYEIGQFLATRPMTSTRMAQTVLKVAGKSLLMGWLLWIVFFALTAGIMYLSGTVPQPFLPSTLRWWTMPATLAGSWTITTVIASVLLSGRPRAVVLFSCVGFVLSLALLIISSYWPQPVRTQFLWGLAVAIGACMVLVTICVFTAAYRHQRISTSVFGSAAVIWVLLAAMIMLEWSNNRSEPVAAYLFTIGLAAMSVFPLAAAPLALAWNRTR